MTLSPLDIHNKDFSRSFRGFQEDEVHDFLDQIMRDYEMLIRNNRDLEKDVKDKQERIDYFQSIEETLNQSILVAQNAAKDIKQNAEKEAQLIIQEAEKNADRIVNESLIQSREAAHEIESLKKHAKVLRSRLKMLIETQLDMVNHDDWDHLLEDDTGSDIESTTEAIFSDQKKKENNDLKKQTNKENLKKEQERKNAEISNPIEDNSETDSVTAQVNYSFSNVNFDENLVDDNQNDNVNGLINHTRPKTEADKAGKKHSV